MYLGINLMDEPPRIFDTAKAEAIAAMMQSNEEDGWLWKAKSLGNGKAIVECFEANGYKIGHI